MALTQSYFIRYVNNQTNIHSITYFLLSDKSAINHDHFGLYEVRNDGTAEFSINYPALLLWYIYRYAQYPYIRTTLMCDISFSSIHIWGLHWYTLILFSRVSIYQDYTDVCYIVQQSIQSIRTKRLRPFIVFVRPPSLERLRQTRRNAKVITNYQIERNFRVRW